MPFLFPRLTKLNKVVKRYCYSLEMDFEMSLRNGLPYERIRAVLYNVECNLIIVPIVIRD